MSARFSTDKGVVEISYADRQRDHVLLTPIARQAAAYLEIQAQAAFKFLKEFPKLAEGLFGGRPSCDVESILADGVPKVAIRYGARTRRHRLHPTEAMQLAKFLRAAADDAERHARPAFDDSLDDATGDTQRIRKAFVRGA